MQDTEAGPPCDTGGRHGFSLASIDVINAFYVFYSGNFLRFLTFFLIFPRFFILKKLSNAKYKYVKIQRKIFLEDDLAMVLIDFGLLRSHCTAKYLTYLLKSSLKSYKFGNLTTDI